MKKNWVSVLLCVLLVVGMAACGSPRGKTDKRRKWAAPQTGTNIGRWEDEVQRSRQARAERRAGRPKRERRTAAKAAKAKRERAERKRTQEEADIVTRGGFR